MLWYTFIVTASDERYGPPPVSAKLTSYTFSVLSILKNKHSVIEGIINGKIIGIAADVL